MIFDSEDIVLVYLIRRSDDLKSCICKNRIMWSFTARVKSGRSAGVQRQSGSKLRQSAWRLHKDICRNAATTFVESTVKEQETLYPKKYVRLWERRAKIRTSLSWDSKWTRWLRHLAVPLLAIYPAGARSLVLQKAFALTWHLGKLLHSSEYLIKKHTCHSTAPFLE